MQQASPWLRAADHLSDRLLWWLRAPAAGLVLRDPASQLAARTPLILTVLAAQLAVTPGQSTPGCGHEVVQRRVDRGNRSADTP